MDLDTMISEALGDTRTKKHTRRSRAYYRSERNLHIARKKGIIKRVSGVSSNKALIWTVKHDGELAKGKIHCSCPMCRFYGPSYSDMKKNVKEDYERKAYMRGVY